jgi:hypothetical protein
MKEYVCWYMRVHAEYRCTVKVYQTHTHFNILKFYINWYHKDTAESCSVMGSEYFMNLFRHSASIPSRQWRLRPSPVVFYHPWKDKRCWTWWGACSPATKARLWRQEADCPGRSLALQQQTFAATDSSLGKPFEPHRPRKNSSTMRYFNQNSALRPRSLLVYSAKIRD